MTAAVSRALFVGQLLVDKAADVGRFSPFGLNLPGANGIRPGVYSPSSVWSNWSRRHVAPALAPQFGQADMFRLSVGPGGEQAPPGEG